MTFLQFQCDCQFVTYLIGCWVILGRLFASSLLNDLTQAFDVTSMSASGKIITLNVTSDGKTDSLESHLLSRQDVSPRPSLLVLLETSSEITMFSKYAEPYNY